MAEASRSQRSIRTIRLDDALVTEMLNRLDSVEVDASSGAARKRNAQRYQYRVKALVVHMQQPGSGEAVPYLVPSRNISEGGLSFIHGGFVHIGTRCVVQLITSHGTWNNAIATVTRCRYLENNLHEVGVSFDRPIDPAEYCAEAAQCRILLAEDDKMMARLACFHLDQLNAVVEHVSNGREAVDQAMKTPYDVILMDIDMPVLDGYGATKELREKGYTGIIVAMTAMTSQEDQRRFFAVGCDRFLGKPVSKEDLSDLVRSLQEEPLFSTMSGDSSISELIDAFVEDLPQKIRGIESARNENDIKALTSVVRLLKASGSSYGFDIISETAAGAETELLEGKKIEDTLDKIDKLVKLCMQARGTSKKVKN